jgi:hypothetical protein
MEIESTGKRGYLHEDYRLFHIKDKRALDVDYHYHEFDKVVVFISGKVTYIVEGKSYFLQPWDILLVGHDRIHRPLIDTSEPYERIILWMNTDFVSTNSSEAYDLSQCFRLARQRSFSLLRPEAGKRPEIMRLLSSALEAARSSEFAGELLARTYFLQFMIEINRMAETDDTEKDATTYKSDPKMEELISYINENLRGDLSLDRLSQKFYISKSHLMHKFKNVAAPSFRSMVEPSQP